MKLPKNEIGKYGMEESGSPREPYVSRRGFLKLAAGLAATDFGKLMEAWAGEQTSFYIDSETEMTGDYENFKNDAKAFPDNVKSLLSESGRIKMNLLKADVVVKLKTFYMNKGRDGDWVKITAEYVSPDGTVLDHKTYREIRVNNLLGSGSLVIAEDIEKFAEGYKGMPKKPIKDAEATNNLVRVKTFDGKEIIIDKSKLTKAYIKKSALEGLKDPDPKKKAYWIEMLVKDNFVISGNDENSYYMILP